MFNKALDEGSLNSQIEPLPDLSPLRAKLDEFDAPGSPTGIDIQWQKQLASQLRDLLDAYDAQLDLCLTSGKAARKAAQAPRLIPNPWQVSAGIGNDDPGL